VAAPRQRTARSGRRPPAAKAADVDDWVTVLMGHESIASTMIYTAFDPGRAAEAVMALGRPRMIA
jgi:hypothetical protein